MPTTFTPATSGGLATSASLNQFIAPINAIELALVALQAAPPAHTHVIADVTNLQTTLDGKAPSSHTHAIADVTNLQTTLDGKAAVSSLATKSDVGHTHPQTDVTGLTTALAGKAASVHTHAISDVTGLQTALDAKLTGPLSASDIPNISTDKLTSGTLPVARGGTGLTALGTALHGLRVNAAGNALEFAAASATENSKICGYIYRSTNQSALSSGSDNVILFDAETYDPDGYHDTGSNTERWTIPSGGDGDYLVITGLILDWLGDHTVEFLHRKNGTRYGRAGSYRYRDSAGYYARQHWAVTPMPGLVAGDYIDCVAKPDSANCIPVGGAAAACISILVRLK